MKTLLMTMTAVLGLTAGAALAGHTTQVTDQQVESVIDARLHEMLVKLNAQKK
jgi:hypothetical protein